MISGCLLHCSYKTYPNISVNYGLPEHDAVLFDTWLQKYTASYQKIVEA